MRDAIVMWRHTKMVVLVAVTGAAYVAVMMPFKGIVIFPGFAEVRPGVVIPVVCGMIFGPAAAWGSAFGNLVADLFGGMFGLGSLFGMVGNFLLAYVPYRTWRLLRGDREADGSPRTVPWFILCTAAGSFCCGVVIGAGLELLGLFLMALFTPLIALLNTVFAGALGALLMPLLYPRAKKWGLVYTDIMRPASYRGHWPAWPGLVLIATGGVGGVLLSANEIPGALAQQEAEQQVVTEAPAEPEAEAPPGEGTPGHGRIIPTPASPTLGLVGVVCSALILLGAVLMSPLGTAATTEPPEPAEPDGPPGERDEA